MKNIKVEIMFDGRNYYGMQRQNDKPTIQGEIEKALKQLFNEDINLIYAGRTDRGVSAHKMVANFFVDTNIESDKIAFALNQFLPANIKIIKSSEVEDNFNSRLSSKYCYSLYISKVELPIFKFETCFKNKLNFRRMKKSIKYFKGTKDFTSFVTSSCEIENKVRTITKVKLERYKQNNIEHIKFYFTGNGFLYNQVRIMVGTIILAGLNKIKAKDIKNILLSKDRTKAGSVMPAEGLSLIDITY